MGQGDVPTSRGGPLRRRKEKRQLEHLAASTDAGWDATSRPRRTSRSSGSAGSDGGDPEKRENQTHRRHPAATPPRTGGFHVRAVPIDQPVGD